MQPSLSTIQPSSSSSLEASPPSYSSVFNSDLEAIFSSIERLAPRYTTQQVQDSNTFEHHLSSAQLLVSIDKLHSSHFRNQKANANSTNSLIEMVSKTERLEEQRAGFSSIDQGDRVLIDRIRDVA